LKLARENSRWAYKRFEGELRKLGHCCSHQTVRGVLRRHGVEVRIPMNPDIHSGVFGHPSSEAA